MFKKILLAMKLAYTCCLLKDAEHFFTSFPFHCYILPLLQHLFKEVLSAKIRNMQDIVSSISSTSTEFEHYIAHIRREDEEPVKLPDEYIVKITFGMIDLQIMSSEQCML